MRRQTEKSCALVFNRYWFSFINSSVPPWSITVCQSCFLCTSHIRQKDSLCSASFVITILQSLHVRANCLVTIRPIPFNIAFEAIVSFLSETTVCHIAAQFSREINHPRLFSVSFSFKISSVSFCQRSYIARLSVHFHFCLDGKQLVKR